MPSDAMSWVVVHISRRIDPLDMTPTLLPDLEGLEDADDGPPGNSFTAQAHSAHELKKRLAIAWDAAAHLSRAFQLSNKERRDVSRREPVYEPGQQEEVLLRRPTNDKTGTPSGGKLAPIYEGPFRIAELQTNGNVKLEGLTNSAHDIAHVTRLRDD